MLNLRMIDEEGTSLSSTPAPHEQPCRCPWPAAVLDDLAIPVELAARLAERPPVGMVPIDRQKRRDWPIAIDVIFSCQLTCAAVQPDQRQILIEIKRPTCSLQSQLTDWLRDMFRKIRRRIRRRLYFTTENLVRCLRLFHDVVSETPLADKYWVCCGMLLGYAREGRLIDNDFDFDFHYWPEDVAELEEALEQLQSAGFKKRFRWVNNDGHTTEFALIYKEIKFEFFEATRHQDCIRWYTYHHRPPRQYTNEVPAFELEPFEFYDRQWLKPVDHESYLESVYGDWQTPAPNYSFYSDCKAIIGHEPWTGDNRW